MKLILAIVSNDDASSVNAALTKENYSVTRLATTGGFLRAGNTTMIVGTEDDFSFVCVVLSLDVADFALQDAPTFIN